MLIEFTDLIKKQDKHSLEFLDLYQDPPPWYDESTFEYLWSPDQNPDGQDISSPTVEYLRRHTERLKEMDMLVIAVPVWNSFVPAIFKAWIDLIISPNHIYQFGQNGIQPLHKIKRALFLISSGGLKEKVNDQAHFENILLGPFRYIGITDIETIWADGQEKSLYADADERLQQAITITRNSAERL